MALLNSIAGDNGSASVSETAKRRLLAAESNNDQDVIAASDASSLDSVIAELEPLYQKTEARGKPGLPNGKYEFEVVRATIGETKFRGEDAIRENWLLKVVEPVEFAGATYEREFIIQAKSLNIVRSQAQVFHLATAPFNLRDWVQAIPHTVGCRVEANITTKNSYTSCYFQYLREMSAGFKNYLTEVKLGGSSGQDVIRS